MLFGYLDGVGTRGQAWLSKVFNVLDSPSYPKPTIGPAMVGPGGKLFNIQVPIRLENAILRFVLQTNQIFPLNVRLFNCSTSIMQP